VLTVAPFTIIVSATNSVFEVPSEIPVMFRAPAPTPFHIPEVEISVVGALALPISVPNIL
jgi:hypothetical protein